MAKSRAEWSDYIKALILSVDRNFDVDFGDINGVFVQPQSISNTELDAEITRLDQIIDPNNYNLMTDDEFQALLNNYLLEVLQGSRAVGQVYFQTDNLSMDITIPAGFPVATDQNAYGQSIMFYTTAQVQMLVANRALYFNNVENLYEIPVDVQCTTSGSVGRVPGGAISVLMRTIPGITAVVNKNSFTSGGVDVESRARSIRRLKGFLKSAGSIALRFGLANDLLLYVEDVVVVGARDAGFGRTSHESGAVDAYATEVTYQQATDYFRVGYMSREDYGSNEVWIFQNQPVVDIAPFTVTIDGVDHSDWFEIVKDVSAAYAGSIRARDVLKVLPAHVVGLSLLVGKYAVVTYNYNLIISTLQQIYTADDRDVLGRDFLMREATRNDVYIQATLKALPGYDPANLADLAASAIFTYVNSLSIAEPLEMADVIYLVKSFAGVDNFTFSDFRLTSEVPGTVHDVVATSREYLRITSSNLVVGV